MELKNNKTVTLDVADRVATLTINRPEVMNALDAEAYRAIEQFADFVDGDDDILVGVITGSGAKAFAAGADVKMLREWTVSEILAGLVYRACDKLENCRKPIIAAINGAVIGGGFEVALACDLRFASENALFGLPETSLGIMPAAGATQRLPRLVGVGWAKEMILTGRRLKADEALRLGIVTRVVKQEDLMAEVAKAVEAIKARAPIGLQLSKRIIMAGMSVDLETGLFLEKTAVGLLINTADAQEGMAAFVEKRPPNYTGK